MRHTHERGELVHFAGAHALSPALDAQGAPAFSAEVGDGLARCGWEAFFRQVEGRRLALAFDPADAGSARFVPASAARGDATAAGGLGRAVAHSRRFWAALFPGKAA